MTGNEATEKVISDMRKELERIKEFQDDFLEDKDSFYAHYHGPMKHITQYDDNLSIGYRQANFREGYAMAIQHLEEILKES